ncbi:hypothetical protein TNCV_3666601 [Trichonephila clavipes]|nr:hypothetical protein TNCV_3666601 [Trichonephila clavipes]
MSNRPSATEDPPVTRYFCRGSLVWLGSQTRGHRVTSNRPSATEDPPWKVAVMLNFRKLEVLQLARWGSMEKGVPAKESS